MKNDRPFPCGRPWILFLWAVCCLLICLAPSPAAAGEAAVEQQGLRDRIQSFAELNDRSTGSTGNLQAASIIKQQLAAAGPEVLDTLDFTVPVRRQSDSLLRVNGQQLLIHSLLYNAITPESLPPEGITAPLVYVGTGKLRELNGKQINGAILLMEFDSGHNWLNAASLGASALIYINRGRTTRDLFLEKEELSPIQFPCFWIEETELLHLLPDPRQADFDASSYEATLSHSAAWEIAAATNIYALFPGTDPEKNQELVVVEAFYDSTSFINNRAPGADEALSIAGLLELAVQFSRQPPSRPFLLIASDAHAQSQEGMRETIWAASARSKDLRRQGKDLKGKRKNFRQLIEILQQFQINGHDTVDGTLFQEAINHTVKLEIDALSTLLIRLRMDTQSKADSLHIATIAEQRLLLRRISWRNEFNTLSTEEQQLLTPLIEKAIHHHTMVLNELGEQEKRLKTTLRFRSLLAEYEPRAIISLHLSSHGNGLGAFHRGFLYPLRPIINRTTAYRAIDKVLIETASRSPITRQTMFISDLRPDRLRLWQDLLPARPMLGGEVSSLAGFPGLTLATTGDSQSLWGTPFDSSDQIDWPEAARQVELATTLIRGIDRAEELPLGNIRNGFSTISGKATLLLHGELFAAHPAPQTALLAFQGPARYHALTDQQGNFQIKGVADKKHVLDKVILEGYRFDPHNGEVTSAIDKKTTGKAAYRIKMQRNSMNTDLVMFDCKQTTIFNLLEPRSFRYMTKLQLIDGRRESPPVRYWYSRIDTRSSIIASIFLEPEARLKLTLSDSVLQKKMIMTNANEKNPAGIGYKVEEHPSLFYTQYLTARDMWSLLTPRINNLEEHGIHNERIAGLRDEGRQALINAGNALDDLRYDLFTEESNRSWALASRVYDHVEKTQKDVLFGVLFYIALFVPFAFCMERLLFGFVSIYKRIAAFGTILLVLIVLIARVHPAFELAYSPTVVILAFFIIGLSFLVTMIIILRFEDEMVLMQRRSSHKRPAEISNWKAFMAAFFLGVSNLRRRRIRTVLTCLTLIILTFTIMSFTTVKSMRRQNQLQFANHAPYQGILLKNIGWQDLPQESLSSFTPLFDGKVLVAPRVWFSGEDPTRTPHIIVSSPEGDAIVQGLTGLSAEEPLVSGIEKTIIKGRWFRVDEPFSLLLPSGLADRLQIDPSRPEKNQVTIWGRQWTVTGVFSEKQLLDHTDLDGEILTPVIFPSETMMEMSEVEQEALESGEDVRSFQGRYTHIPPEQTLILPASTLLRLGGTMKAVALGLERPPDADTAKILTDRFSLSLFSGEEKGVFLYNASDTMSYSGMPNIVIPLLISILIVLNTMISSVYERKREIAVYTAVGLAPRHVSFLFIAEALAFAVISVVLGYLLAQTSAGLLANTAMWQGITVNYSSTAGVAAMVLVMAVVLLSVIYPSRVAAKIAIPDVNQTWELPQAEDNAMQVTLPFLMRYHEHASICGFLYTYFKGHQDVSHGVFATGPIEIVETSVMEEHLPVLPQANECVHLRAKVWLAPFDFGIMQWVDLRFCPAREGEDFLEICVTMTRRSGEFTLWRRINASFLHALRKQLLIWRSLDAEGHAHYGEMLPAPANTHQESV